MKKRNQKKATLVASIAILLISVTMLLHLFGAFIWVEYAKNCAAEIYRAETLSPNGASETFPEMLENIKQYFSNSSWALRLVSGNTDKGTSFVLVSAILLAFISSIIAIRVELQIKEKKAKEKKKAEAKKRYAIAIEQIDRERKAGIIHFLSANPID